MKNLKVMVAGLPGNMACLTASAIKRTQGMTLATVGLSHTKNGSFTQPDFGVFLVPVEEHVAGIRKNNPDLIVDFSRGSAEANCKTYCELGVPFVMGATGGSRSIMEKMVKESQISAVIAPNMAPEIVVLQAMLEFAANTFPGVLSDYSLRIAESHQKGKADVSGTALVFEKLLNKMGAISNDDGIVSIRDPLIQEYILGINKIYLDAHAHHEYILESEDGTAHLGLIHNIDGRNSYVNGTIMAIRFLGERINLRGSIFSMVDVLQNLNSRF